MRVSRRLMLCCLLAGVVALLIQYAIIPFYAPPGFGLFANGGDFWVYRLGAEQVLKGDSLYSLIPPGVSFTYPPMAAILFVPLTFGAPATTSLIWFLLSVAALGSVVWRCFRVCGYSRDWKLAVASFGITLAFFDLEAIRGTIWQGQINILIMAIIVWDLTRPSGARLRGWSVGIAAGIKLTALLFLPYLVVTRQWRAAATAAISAILTVGIGAALLPADSRDYWLHDVGMVSRIGDVTHPANQSVNGVLANLSAPRAVPLALWLVCATVVVALALAAAARYRNTSRETFSIVLVGLAACAATPLAWSHHWVWFAPVIVLLFIRAHTSPGPARWRWGIATVGLAVAASMWLTVLIYEIVKSIGQVGAAGAAPAMDAAIEQIPSWARALTCGVPVVVLIFICSAALLIARKTEHARQQPADSAAPPER
ncbi:glycosyltransferase 87 family protein [Tsukamurella sp. 8F]|uniref:glycosyltransferase 87 family protein n=1 Tax=unclassified Tsukamurella TaxID=2633480 RepID=UPI0023B92205|nr:MULTISPECIES: glycosyltransferase 87 family protein [unclassified Tsukamurella]MDF0530484.1 glycosyltransferase 87 family protein [Tsukamurella sp. 8J]MDF0587695.1 glycosyltransferase 87 family protein [Tsukamurella sp. 8F]